MSTQRLVSLDAFRGFTIAAMLLVNNPGSWSHLYAPLEHAKWNGWTFTDWIFPFFLFISGISMALSFRRLSEQGASRASLWRKATVRAGIVFVIGLALNLFPYFNFAAVRIPGVLQRIALCTFLAAPLLLYFDWRGQAVWIIGLFALYAGLMLGVPVPDALGVWHTGSLDPGQDFGAYVDRALLSGHLWVSSKTWDPEGLVSTLPAVSSSLFGALTGRFLSGATRTGAVPTQASHDALPTGAEPATQTVWLLLAGLACLWVGQVMDSLVMPINKSLWTPSYAVFMTGWGLLVFGTFYWLLDACPVTWVRRHSAKVFSPFVIYGMNALFLFALSGVIAKLLNFIKFAQPDGSQMALKTVLYAPLQALALSAVNTSLLYAVLFNLMMFVIALAMWRKRWFVKV